jgi:hypothetical protein
MEETTKVFQKEDQVRNGSEKAKKDGKRKNKGICCNRWQKIRKSSKQEKWSSMLSNVQRQNKKGTKK